MFPLNAIQEQKLGPLRFSQRIKQPNSGWGIQLSLSNNINTNKYNEMDDRQLFLAGVVRGVVRHGIRAGIEEALRQQQNETNAPPSYHEAINTATPPPPQDSLPRPRLLSHPNGHSPRTMSPPAAYPRERTAQERDSSTPQRKMQRLHAERMVSD